LIESIHQRSSELFASGRSDVGEWLEERLIEGSRKFMATLNYVKLDNADFEKV
jgi:hypothetical protein